MTVLQVFQKVMELRTALVNGDWILAAQVAIEIAQAFLSRDGASSAIEDAEGELTEDNEKELKAALKEIKSASDKPPRGAKAAVGGPVAIALITVLGPVIVRLIEQWWKNRNK